MPEKASPNAESLLKLVTFLSPAFPIGSYSYSHGLEWAIVDAKVTDADSLRDWISDVLRHGSGWNDAVLLVAAYHAAATKDAAVVQGIAALGEALAGSRERHMETMQQGEAFLAAVTSAWSCEEVSDLIEDRAPLPISVAVVSAGHDIPLDLVLPAYLNASCSNLVSVAVRLVPLGQTAGLRVTAELHAAIAATAARALGSSLDDLGSASILSDIASMRHEEQYSRVFRT